MDERTETAESRTVRWTTTFERLPEEKRLRIFEVAKRSFSSQGFAGANINRMAEEAGISIGAMYKYFRTKEDLFLALIESLHDLIATTLDDILASSTSFRGRVEAILRVAVESSAEDPEAVRLYIACTTDELAPLASRLSTSIEEVSAGRYRRMVEEAQAKGEVDPSLDPGWAAFFLDDLFLMAQFSAGSLYYRERLRLFLGRSVTEAGGEDFAGEELVSRVLPLLLKAMGAA